MATHNLKTWSLYFDAVWRGTKTAEIRKDDRGFAQGDILHLIETKLGETTGRSITARVSHKVTKFEGLAPGYVLLSLADVRRYQNTLPVKAGEQGVPS